MMEKPLKQQTFGEPEPEVKKQSKRKHIQGMVSGPSYWICKKGHVFEQKNAIFEHQIEKMNCPICFSKIQNKSSKSTYEYYLKKENRIDMKQYRANEIKRNKKSKDKIRQLK